MEILGIDYASGPDITVTAVVYLPPPKVVNLAKYRKSKMWREFRKLLEAGKIYFPEITR